MRNPSHRRIAVCALASLLVHVVLLVAYLRWVAPDIGQILRPVRYQPLVINTQPFRPVPQRFLPTLTQQQRAASPFEPRPLPDEAHVEPADPLPLSDPAPLQSPSAGAASRDTGPLTERLPTLEEMQWQMAQRAADDREADARIHLPDSDTTDAEQDPRQIARRIVLAAVEAMGGMDALMQITDATFQGRRHKGYGPRSRYSQILPGGYKLFFDGTAAWVDLPEGPYPVTGEGLREVQRRSERWDFLSRYLGDGVRLLYLGTQPDRRGDRVFHVLSYEDMRFGGTSFRAYFDSESHRLEYEEIGTTLDPAVRIFYKDYGPVQDATIWHTREYHYLKAIRNAIIRHPVSYQTIPDSVFLPSQWPGPWGRLDTHEHDATLWLDVVMENGRATPALPGSRSMLTYDQRQRIAHLAEDSMIDDLGRRGLFRTVRAASADTSRVRPTDFRLQVTLFQGYTPCSSPVLYRARLYAGTSMTPIMQDGPTSGCYYEKYPAGPSDPGCTPYGLQLVSIDAEGAFLGRGVLQARLQHTSDKIARAVRAHAAGTDLYSTTQHYCR